MEFKSFSQIHLIADRSELNDQLSSGHNFLYSIILDIGSEEAADTVFNYIFSDKNDKLFSITLLVNDNFSGSIAGRWLNRLFLILSHPLYYKHQNKLILGIFSGSTTKYSYQVLVRQLVSELAKQNFKVLFLDFNHQSLHALSSPFFYLNDAHLLGQGFYDWYLNKLESNNSTLHFFYRYTTAEEAIRIIQRKKDAEIRIEKESPLLFKLIEKEILFSEKKNQFESIIQDLKADLFSKKEYLEFLQGKNLDGKLDDMDMLTSMKIKKFYHQEYEILPLWFKRLGHLIKVISGKRSFRSLFNDRVKKYKD